MPRYRVAQVGLGNRGRIHADGFRQNPDRFELVALCELDDERRQQGKDEFGFPALYSDADKMLAETTPDVFCFATLPDVRLELVELALKHGVQGLAFEKPMATSLREAWRITKLCQEDGIKAVVSHQQKYLSSMQTLKELVDAGEIGEVTKTHVTCQGALAQLGTHFMDYTLWALGAPRGQWAVGYVHGRGLLGDSHPSPDYFLGEVCFDTDVRGYIECGTLSRAHLRHLGKFWEDSRLTVHGTYGHAWADTDGRWGAFTKSSNGEVIGEEGEPWMTQRLKLQAPYLRDFADWLDDDAKPHSCRVDLAYHGYEILEAMCRSALDHTRVDLPLPGPESSEGMVDRMRRELPEVPPLPEEE
jgi:predicted dehydrogenase